MDSALGQVLLPLAAGAASAASPYVARGIGPALSVWGATQAQGNQKYRNQLMQSQAEQEQIRAEQMRQEQEQNQRMSDTAARIVREQTPIPGTPPAVERGYSAEPGLTFAQATGQTALPTEPPRPDLNYTPGLPYLDPTTAQLVGSLSGGNALKFLSDVSARQGRMPLQIAQQIGATLKPNEQLQDVETQVGKYSAKGEAPQVWTSPEQYLLNTAPEGPQRQQLAKELIAAKKTGSKWSDFRDAPENQGIPMSTLVARFSRMEQQPAQIPGELGFLATDPRYKGMLPGDLIAELAQQKGRVSPEDIKANVELIYRHQLPPVPQSRAAGDWQKITAEMARAHPDFDFQKEGQAYNAVNVFMQTNAQQAVPLRRNIQTARAALAGVQKAFDEWKAAGVATGFRDFNQQALAAAMRVPGPAGNAARRLNVEIENASRELAKADSFGASPTNQLGDASKLLSASWSEGQLTTAVQSSLEHLQSLDNAILTARPIAGEGTYYTPPAPQSTQQQVAPQPIARAPKGTPDGNTTYKGQPAKVQGGLIYAR